MQIELKFFKAFATSLVLFAASPMLAAAEDPLKVCIESAVSKLKVVNADQEKLADAKALTAANVSDLRAADEKIIAARDAKGDDLVRCNNWKNMIQNKASIVFTAQALKEASDKLPKMGSSNGADLGGVGKPAGSIKIGEKTPLVIGFSSVRAGQALDVSISTYVGLGSTSVLAEKVCHQFDGRGAKKMTGADYKGDVTVVVDLRRDGCSKGTAQNPVVCSARRTFIRNENDPNNMLTISGFKFSEHGPRVLEACKFE